MWGDSSWNQQHAQYMQQIQADTNRTVMDAQWQARNAERQGQQQARNAVQNANSQVQNAQRQVQEQVQNANRQVQQSLQNAQLQVQNAQRQAQNAQQQGQRSWCVPPAPPPPTSWQQYAHNPHIPNHAERQRMREETNQRLREARDREREAKERQRYQAMQAHQRTKEAQQRQRQQLQEARNTQRMLHQQAREREREARQQQRQDAYANAFHGQNQSNYQTNEGGSFMQVQFSPTTGGQWMQFQTGDHPGESFPDGGQWENIPEGGDWESYPSSGMMGQTAGDGQWEHFPFGETQDGDLSSFSDMETQPTGQASVKALETLAGGTPGATLPGGTSGATPQQQQMGPVDANTAPLDSSMGQQDKDQNPTQSGNDKAPNEGDQTENITASTSVNQDATISIKKEPKTEDDTNNDDSTVSGLAAGANADNPTTATTSNTKPDLTTFLADAEGDLTCPICFELMRDPHTPKNLNCGHVCCLVCLHTMTQNSRNIQCPICRFITCTTGLHVQNMRTNWHVKNLAETYHKHSQENHGTQQQNYGPCKVHGDLIRYYCDSCNKIGCGSCIYESHNKSQHDVKNLREVCEKNKMEINNLLERSITKSEETKKVLDKIEKEKQSCEEHVLLEEEKIDAEMHDKIAKVYEAAEEKKTKLRNMSQARLGTIEKEKQELQTKRGEIQQAIAASLEAIESSTEYDYVTKHKKLVHAMKNCL